VILSNLIDSLLPSLLITYIKRAFYLVGEWEYCIV
jgi:hypothetical protein